MEDQSIDQFYKSLEKDPLNEFLPVRKIKERQIKIEWIEDQLRIVGAVKPGMPSKLNTFSSAKSFSCQPAYFRRGVRQADDLDMLAEQAAYMLSLLRVHLLNGGIDYTDPESGINITAPSGIPTRNQFTYKGIGDLLAKLENPRRMVGGGEGQWVVLCNKFVEEALAGALPDDYRVLGNRMLYDDLVEGVLTRKHAWPIDNITMIWVPEDLPGVTYKTVGATYLTTGENPDQEPGYWLRYIPAVDGLNADLGVDLTRSPFERIKSPEAWQGGVAGLPVLNKPSRVFTFKPA